jgi:predicted HD phosphohydrolase
VTYTPRFSEALATAHELHRMQKRKGTEVPYISHLLLVAGIAIEHGANEEEAIAALLHDAIEDSDATVESLTIVVPFVKTASGRFLRNVFLPVLGFSCCRFGQASRSPAPGGDGAHCRT